MSVERRKILSALGAEIVLTPAEKGMTGANEEAERLHAEISGSIIAGQFDNPRNPEAHRAGTAKEILEDTDGEIDYFIAGIGTGGTITGVGEVLKQNIDGVKIVGVEPSDSPLLTTGQAGAHKIQGIGANFVPKVLNMDVVDEVMTATTEESYKYARLLAKTEGFTCGISGGAVLACAVKLLQKTPQTHIIFSIMMKIVQFHSVMILP
jgi:cysteine synthase A